MADLIFYVPKYAKFAREIAANKDKYFDEALIPLSNRCSFIIKKAIAISLKVADTGNCTISCGVGKMYFEKALCDQRSGVSIMPLSILLHIGIVEMMRVILVLFFLSICNSHYAFFGYEN